MRTDKLKLVRDSRNKSRLVLESQEMSAVLDYILKGLREFDGSERAYAEKIGVKYGALRSWIERGSEPSADKVETILKNLGGDITRALPDYSPSERELAGYASPVKIHGEVSAGHASYSQSPIETEQVLETCYGSSPHYSITQGPIVHLKVSGDSMEPDFPHRSLLACRAPWVAKEAIPNGTPCIMLTSDGDTTFKLFQYSKAYGRVLAIPINESYDVQIFKPSEVEVQLIVVGISQAMRGARRPASASNPMILRED